MLRPSRIIHSWLMVYRHAGLIKASLKTRIRPGSSSRKPNAARPFNKSLPTEMLAVCMSLAIFRSAWKGAAFSPVSIPISPTIGPVLLLTFQHFSGMFLDNSPQVTASARTVHYPLSAREYETSLRRTRYCQCRYGMNGSAFQQMAVCVELTPRAAC